MDGEMTIIGRPQGLGCAAHFPIAWQRQGCFVFPGSHRHLAAKKKFLFFSFFFFDLLKEEQTTHIVSVFFIILPNYSSLIHRKCSIYGSREELFFIFFLFWQHCLLE